jgi:hypothetical protein
MLHSLFASLFVVSIASTAVAQDGLTPTDVLDGGHASVTGRLQFTQGQGTLTSGTIDLDADISEFQFILEGAVGLGMGFEVEASLPYQFTGDLEIDGAGTTQEFEEIGFGDLLLSPVYRLLGDGKECLQVIAGAMIVLPTGKKEPAEPEGSIGPLPLNGEEGGIGNGIWRFGALAGISMRAGLVEPYFTVSWLSGGTTDVQNDSIEVERPDLWTLTLGSEFHLGEQITFDLRTIVEVVGDEIEENSLGVETTEESHFQNGWQAQLSYTAGAGLTLIAGVGVSFLDDSTVDDTANIDLEDTFFYSATVGIHIVLGGK